MAPFNSLPADGSLMERAKDRKAIEGSHFEDFGNLRLEYIRDIQGRIRISKVI
jgi:hypothetical protein